MSRVREIETRLLLPFCFKPRGVADAVDALVHATFRDRPLWTAVSEHELNFEHYRHEFHAHVLRNLFGQKVAVARYLQLPEATAAILLPRRKTMSPPNANEPSLPISSIAPLRAELFLSPYGVGVLSLAWQIDRERLPTELDDDLLPLAVNYRLSQLQPWSAPRIVLDHPQADAQRWESIAVEQRAAIAPPPADNAPLEQRLSAAGGAYTLQELAGVLTAPLERVGFKPTQAQFSVYTVVRLDETVDFADAAQRETWSRLLSGLAQVEEPRHAGALPAQPTVEHQLLNRNHWAAVGSLGAAHLVCDQGQGVAFDEQRVSRARDKYFLPYLLALLQRQALLHTSEKISDLVREVDLNDAVQCEPKFRGVLLELSEFAATYYAPDVSTREVLNRYYHSAQVGLKVDSLWQRVGESVRNLDSLCRSTAQEELVKRSADSLKGIHEMTKATSNLLEESKQIQQESKNLQGKVEWVEVFIVAVYVAELLHIVGESFQFNHTFLGATVLACSLAAMWTARRVLDPDHAFKLDGLTPRIKWTAFAILILFLILGIVSRVQFPNTHHESPETRPEHETHRPVL